MLFMLPVVAAMAPVAVVVAEAVAMAPTVAGAVEHAATVLHAAEAVAGAATALIAVAADRMEMSFSPRLSDNVFYSNKEDKHLFLNPDLPDWVVLNQNATYVVAQFDGKKTVTDIISSIEQDGAVFKQNDVVELIKQLSRHGIIDDAIAPAIINNCKCLQTDNPKLHLVHIKLTDECNLSCKYCYAESGSTHKKFMSLEELKSVVDKVGAIATGVDFTLSGGEPLLHPSALELMEYIKSVGGNIFLITNCLMINNANAQKITKLCSLIKISIDGSCEEINSITRGRHSFDGALNGYTLLKNEGANVQVSMTVTKANINDIQNMTNMFGNRLTLQPFFKAGRGTDNEYLQITGKEYYEAMAKIEGFKPIGRIGELLETLRRNGMSKCAMADAEISISENGDVFPCQLLAEDELRGGNIKHDSLQDILNSEVFKKAASFSSLTNEGCSTCPIKLLCGGACRARSYLETGSLFVNSDFCEYEQLAYINGIFDSVSFGGKNEANI